MSAAGGAAERPRSGRSGAGASARAGTLIASAAIPVTKARYFIDFLRSIRLRKRRFRLRLANTPGDEIIPSGTAIGACCPRTENTKGSVEPWTRKVQPHEGTVPGERCEPRPWVTKLEQDGRW